MHDDLHVVQLAIPGSYGQLEGRLLYREESENGIGAILCPPHPLLAGNMDNNVVQAVARQVVSGQSSFGLLVCASGVGMSIAANKVPGIRAALCYDRASARNSREHNHANVLTLGGRLLTASQAEEVLRTWLGTPYGGGRHQKRIDKITEIERRYSVWNK